MVDRAVERQVRRSDALSRGRIVEAAVELLDGSGEAALTFRALARQLSTGAGAIYHHIANKDELLAAATDEIVERHLADVADDPDAREAIRSISLAVFTAIDAHPWVGSQLSREPLQPALLRIWKSLGLQLQNLGLTGPDQSDAGAALVSYVLGAAAQYAAGARQVPGAADRQAYLETVAAQLVHDDSDPSVRDIASSIREHDDREQFLAGVDIFLRGIRGAGPYR